MPDLPRAARLAAWGGALLRGAAGADEALDAVTRGEYHEVRSPDDPQPQPLAVALGLLRRAGLGRLTLVLPVAGDPSGLAGPPATNAEAVAAGEVVLASGAEGTSAYAFIPRVELRGSSLVAVTWHRLPAGPPRTALPSLAEADRELKEVLLEATAELVRLDVARWRPDVAAALGDLRNGSGAEPLPRDYPPRARDVIARAQLLAGVAALAAEDAGAAVSGTQMTMRSAALTRLEAASRRALVAAVNAPLEPAQPSTDR